MNCNEQVLRNCIGKTIESVSKVHTRTEDGTDTGYIIYFTDCTSIRLDYIDDAHDVMITN
jgi:hypothetical protein